MEWMLLPLKRYADFSGRSRRMEYWMFALFIPLVIIAAMIIAAIAASISDVLASIVGIVFVIAYLALFIPSLAVSVRRMHDTDHSGWWLLVPIANLIFSFTPGTVGNNRFGPDPKNNDPSATFN